MGKTIPTFIKQDKKMSTFRTRKQSWEHYGTKQYDMPPQVSLRIWDIIQNALDKKPNVYLADVAPKIFEAMERK